MAKERTHDHEFEIRFFESVLNRDPAYCEVVEILGSLYTKHGRIADGLKMDRRLVKLQPANATAHYNLACSLALTSRRMEALRSLRQAVELRKHLEAVLTQERENLTKSPFPPADTNQGWRHAQLVVGPALTLLGTSLNFFDADVRDEIKSQVEKVKAAEVDRTAYMARRAVE